MKTTEQALKDLLDWCAGGDIPQELYDEGRAALETFTIENAMEELRALAPHRTIFVRRELEQYQHCSDHIFLGFTIFVFAPKTGNEKPEIKVLHGINLRELVATAKEFIAKPECAYS